VQRAGAGVRSLAEPFLHATSDFAEIKELSVIIATRHRAHAIAACLDTIASAFAHAAPLDAEIVVVDNGSTDATGSIIRTWADAASVPICLMFEPIPGLSRAHNRALLTA
jgi:glycosyltransferase involved in cell wall biosynthesis